MKQFILLIFTFFYLTIYSQNVKIYGTISNPVPNNAVILSPAIYSKLIDSKIELNPKNGSFEFNIQINNPVFYRLYYKDKRISLYLEPNKSIQLNIDYTKSEDYVSFFSDLAKENTILNQKNLPTIGTKEQREKFKQKSLEGKQAYFYSIEAEMIKQKNAFVKISEDANLPSTFTQLYLQNNIEMGGVLYKYYYPRFAFGNIDSFIVTNPDFLELFSEANDLYKYNQSVLFFENQMNFLKAKTNLKFKDNILAKNEDDLLQYKAYIKAANDYPKGVLRDYLLENLIGEWISYYGRITDIKDEIAFFVEQLDDKNKKDLIKKKMVNLAQYETGKPAPIFSFEDYDGNIRNLKEFIGKIVYIDAWASWCGPCIAELPHAKEIYNKYKDNSNIVFLYMSIDDNRDNWEKAIRERNLYDGIQGIAFPNGFNSDFARKYNIQGIPNYILIDKSGNLVTHRAPKPSQPDKLIPLLDKMVGL